MGIDGVSEHRNARSLEKGDPPGLQRLARTISQGWSVVTHKGCRQLWNSMACGCWKGHSGHTCSVSSVGVAGHLRELAHGTLSHGSVGKD